MSNKIEKTIEWCIYQSRWLQVPVYIGMCVVMGMYSYVFCKDVIHSLMNIETFTEETMLMLAIGIVDVSMVLNLIIVCVIGGYWSFVSRLEIIEKDKDSNQFSYLGKINPNALKHKLMISLISISESWHYLIFDLKGEYVINPDSLKLGFCDKNISCPYVSYGI
ncbi:YqhA family protein [Prevotella jejuni]|uniref:UPF0114 protein SAMN06265364_1342 n=1 Tax=Prevotella jejuni TaxID=1177574 RepID=A0AA94RZV1_9BACT|nr:YqhA family protein [Prevotella jejuni]SNS05624.1 TIGR00645 family protein [Prevotella jejuni]